MLSSFTTRDATGKKCTVEVLWEDAHLLVINKPPGIPVVPDRWQPRLPNIRGILQAKYPQPSAQNAQAIWIVHRLDAGTSGVLLLAKSAVFHQKLSQLFEKNGIRKTYLAIVNGCPDKDSGIINHPLRQFSKHKSLMKIDAKGKPSATEYRVIETFRRFSLLAVYPKTGRTHQIRVHLAAINCPLTVDPLYGNSESLCLSSIKRRYHRSKHKAERSLIDRLTLHAFQISFTNPLTHKKQIFEASLPKDFNAALKSLRKWDAVDKTGK